MKRLISLNLIFTILCYSAISQQLDWALAQGGTYIERGYAVAVAPDSSVLATGIFTSTTDFDPGPGITLRSPQNVVDIYIEKLNKNGGLDWMKQIGSTDEILASSIFLSSDGAILLSGTFSGTVDFDPGSGTTQVTSNGQDDAFILRLNADGSFNWVRTLGGSQPETAPLIVVDQLGNVYGTGNFYGTADIDPGPGIMSITTPDGGTSNLAYVLKLSGNGATDWVFPLQATQSSGTDAIAIDTLRNELLITGSFADEIDLDPGSGELKFHLDSGMNFLLKTNLDGSLVRAQVFVKTFLTKRGIATDKQGNIYMTGSFRNTVDFDFGPGEKNLVSKGFADSFVLKIDAMGGYLWAVSMGSTSDESPNTLSLDRHGNVITTGSFYNNPDFDPHPNRNFRLQANTNFANAYIWKLSAYGDMLWAHKILVSGWEARIFGLQVTQDDMITGTGRIYGTADLDPGSGTHTLTNTGTEDDILIFRWSDGCANSSTGSSTVQACNTYTAPSGMRSYTESGIYKDTLTNSLGCDSILTINLTIFQTSRVNITETYCFSYTVPSGKNTYYASGTYSDTLSASTGCDSILTIALTIVSFEAMISNNNNLLTAAPSGATYQWYNCNTNQPVTGQTGDTFAPSENGTYAVIVTQNGCTDTSACTTVTGIGIGEHHGSSAFMLYPNPASGVLWIEAPGISVSTARIFDPQGKICYEAAWQSGPINVSGLPSGLYQVELVSAKKLYHIKFFKE